MLGAEEGVHHDSCPSSSSSPSCPSSGHTLLTHPFRKVEAQIFSLATQDLGILNLNAVVTNGLLLQERAHKSSLRIRSRPRKCHCHAFNAFFIVGCKLKTFWVTRKGPFLQGNQSSSSGHPSSFQEVSNSHLEDGDLPNTEGRASDKGKIDS